MTIATEVREELKNGMKAKDQIALDTYRAILTGFMTELVATGKTPQDEVSDEMALKVIQKLIKQRKDSISQFEAGGRADLANEEKAKSTFEPSRKKRKRNSTLPIRPRLAF
jgi:uncharacterized protein YqeY